LPQEQYEVITSEIDRIVEKGEDYTFAGMEQSDRGWVFCPEYLGTRPLQISPTGWDARIFLFGPGLLPDSDFRRDSIASTSEGGEREPTNPSEPLHSKAQGPDGGLDSAEQPDAVPGYPSRAESATSVENTSSAIGEIRSVSFGTYLLTGAEVRWTLTVKGNPHLLVAGLPGMGKTTCLLNLCKQMLTAGVRPIVFSYHQDLDERLEHLVDSVRFIDFHGLEFNPLQVRDRESRMAYLDVAGALRDIFVAIFPELGDIQAERVRRAIKDSFIGEVG
jgi:DNA phosphorothioation-dependent restriction protein DptH